MARRTKGDARELYGAAIIISQLNNSGGSTFRFTWIEERVETIMIQEGGICSVGYIVWVELGMAFVRVRRICGRV